MKGGDNIDEEAVEVKPTRKEALSTAAFTLQKFIADINEPYARKLEGILTSFGHQTRLEEVHMMEITPSISLISSLELVITGSQF